MEVKICGVTRVQDALAAVRAGADYVGLVMAESARRVLPAVAREVVRELPTSTRAVLLFKNAVIDDAVELVREIGARVVQLHGSESVAYVAELSSHLPGVEFIRAWELTPSGPAAIVDYLRNVNAAGLEFFRIILDSPKTGEPAEPGLFAQIARQCDANRPPLWRAGGLSVDNLPAALAEANYAGVDVARGVEREPGIKDAVLMKRFVELAKGRTSRQ